MKKYLINGVLALFAGIYLVSCADTETDYVPLAEQKAKAFEEVFKEVYMERLIPIRTGASQQT